MESDLARKAKNLRAISRSISWGIAHFAGMEERFGFSPSTASPELEIRPEATLAAGHLFSGLGIRSKLDAFGGNGFLVTTFGRRYWPCVAAFRIVGAADKSAELAKLQRQLPIWRRKGRCADRRRRRRRENMRSEDHVQSVEHFGDTQVLDLAQAAVKSRQKSRST